MTILDVKNLAAALQSFALVIAIVIGGGWALFQFFSIRSIEKAKAELMKLQHETNVHGIIEVSMQTKYLSAYDNLVVIKVSLKNIGVNPECIDLKRSQVVLAPVGDGNMDEKSVKGEITAVHQGVDQVTSFIIVNPGEEKVINYLASGVIHSLYLVQAMFSGSISERDYQTNIATQNGLKADVVTWGGMEYIEAPKC
ncbi:hypothetical protein HUO09_05540 [Vibrio sp. Y2-5]|uniref:hypothetical protein n=1 Tax=Vibrio sp. Y2-5 TaxID=2743977 RepID=UPI00166016EE|nr:hypothetical protein [Vibrio sp. Y2-5]MBD0785795.1 hypothetical protein [Vibrio sp. Y2-5]